MDRIKITDDDIHLLYLSDNSDNCIVKFASLEGNDIEWTKAEAEQLKHQILQDSKDNHWLKSDLAAMKESFNLANNWRNEHLEDSKKLEKIKQAWKNRVFSSEGEDFDEELKKIVES